MSQCSCITDIEDHYKEFTGWCHAYHPRVEISFAADLKRPVKRMRYAKGKPYEEIRTKTRKRITIAPNFCMLCGKAWPK
jgi:hypothetical protein